MARDETDWRDVVLDMTLQFAYRGTKNGVAVLNTGGLSSLEYAFDALGWHDSIPESEAK